MTKTTVQNMNFQYEAHWSQNVFEIAIKVLFANISFQYAAQWGQKHWNCNKVLVTQVLGQIGFRSENT